MPLRPDLYPYWMRACARGKLDELERMIGDDPWPDISSQTPQTSCLILASCNGHEEICRRLLAHRPQLDARDGDGATALMLAAGEGHREIVDLLLGAGADMNAVDDQGNSAFFRAVRNANLGMVKKLLPHATPALINQANNQGETVVMAACHAIDPTVMDLVLTAGGNPNAYNTLDQERAMHCAVLLENADTVRVLARHGARLGHLHNGETYLHTAVRQRSEETVRALLEAGANPLKQNRQRQTAAETAQEIGFSGYAKVLAEHQHQQLDASTASARAQRRTRL